MIELLTVIAIIAILAAIIFPVMARVKETANQNNCMSNLHQISVAVQMFKTDNRRYPDVLSAEVYDTQNPPQRWIESGTNPDVFENAKGKYLFAEYVTTIKGFHCPSAKVTSSRDIAVYPKYPYDHPRNENIAVYAYDSYGCYIKQLGTSDMVGSAKIYSGNAVEQHYTLSWAKDASEAGVGQYTKYPPSEGAGTAKDRLRDYQRQLQFKNPPGDTVVTWCSNHDGYGLVAFLDGHADKYPAGDVDACKWRTRPKK